MWRRLQGNECVDQQKCLVERFAAFESSGESARFRCVDANGDECKRSTAANPRPALIIQAFTNIPTVQNPNALRL